MALASKARPSCSSGSYLLRRCSAVRISFTNVSSLMCCRHAHIGHSTDVHRWRNPEKEEVRRQFRGGVKLGSHMTKVREQEARERRLIEQDKFTDWRLIYNYAIGAALLLIGLNVILAFVESNPSPEYVPYVEEVKSVPKASDTPRGSNQTRSGH
ncbi:hypothetical protein JKF63_00519 [Porcisia hertigi]|uniref:Uncharacterized protein n=1 Tax=Porcisia hertigi TaxID=2761500 RepID=A0A836KX83_9TRYP|nr:hypothetical protein JKF63_00519 [Porcisia hertigi]